MAERLGETMKRTISVCDRESDVCKYLSYKLGQSRRFVLWAQSDCRPRERVERHRVALQVAAQM